MSYPWNGPLSYSLLKTIDSSPADFRHACAWGGIETTSPMRLGTCAHWHLLGGAPEREPLVYLDSKTRGEGARKAWEAFKLAHAGREIHSADEWGEGADMANAVRNAPHNRAHYSKWIEGGTFEQPVEWSYGGFEWRTRGVDVVKGGYLVDIKSARSVALHRLMSQARSLHYAPQLALYRGGLRANGVRVDGCAVFAICSSPPYVVRVMPIPEDALTEAMAKVDGWIATLRQCLDRDEWPGHPTEDPYVPAPWDSPALEGEDDLPEASA